LLSYKVKRKGHVWSHLCGQLKTAFQLLQAETSKLENYVLQERLGSGCNGVVYSAQIKNQPIQTIWEQSQAGEPLSFALKVQIPFHQTTNSANEAFKREYECLEALPIHENICALYFRFQARPTASIISEGWPGFAPDLAEAIFYYTNPRSRMREARITQFLVMEKQRTTLSTYVHQLGRGCSTFLVASLALQLAEGLEHMFQHGYVHLDIKSDNLLISPDGHLVITDFGTSMKMEAGHQLRFSRFAGQTGGNSLHMSPECLAARQSEITFDVSKQPSWELGCVLWYLITGEETAYPGYPDSYFPNYDRLPHLELVSVESILHEANFDSLTLTSDAIRTLGSLCISLLQGQASLRPTIIEAVAILRDLPLKF
jgi:serine/threonine protein kinase